MNKECIYFRTAFFPLWRFVTMWAGAGLAIVLLCFVHVWNIPVNVPQVLISALTATTAALIIKPVLYLFRIQVSEDGLACYDAFSITRFTRWEDIELVRPINILGLRYLRIRAKNMKRELWLPLFLADLSGFIRVVEELAGPENRLTEALELHSG